jgi:hypothetical protein
MTGPAHFPQQIIHLAAVVPADALLTAYAADDLTAVTARRAEADCRGFEYHDIVAAFLQADRARQAGETRADDTYISVDRIREPRIRRAVIYGCRVVVQNCTWRLLLRTSTMYLAAVLQKSLHSLLEFRTLTHAFCLVNEFAAHAPGDLVFLSRQKQTVIGTLGESRVIVLVHTELPPHRRLTHEQQPKCRE